MNVAPMNPEDLKKYTSVSGVVKKKRAVGTVAAVFSASQLRWFCFRGQGRFLVNYQKDKPPVSLWMIQDHKRKA